MKYIDIFTSFLLNGISFVVRGGRRFLCTYSTVLQYSSVVSTCAETKTQGGPRAQEGTRTTGTRRALNHGHLKAAH